MIERIEELSAESEVRTFGDAESLRGRKIQVSRSRPGQHVAAGIPITVVGSWRDRECRRIEPLL